MITAKKRRSVSAKDYAPFVGVGFALVAASAFGLKWSTSPYELPPQDYLAIVAAFLPFIFAVGEQLLVPRARPMYHAFMISLGVAVVASTWYPMGYWFGYAIAAVFYCAIATGLGLVFGKVVAVIKQRVVF